MSNWKDHPPGSYLSIFLEDCLGLLSLFSDINVHFVRRSANQSAHALAREAGLCSDLQEWSLDPPGFLLSLIHSDLH